MKIIKYFKYRTLVTDTTLHFNRPDIYINKLIKLVYLIDIRLGHVRSNLTSLFTDFGSSYISPITLELVLA